MTDFEMEIAKTLYGLLQQAQCLDGFPQPNDHQRAQYLAPHVAAAINAAVQICVNGALDGEGGTYWDDDGPTQAALAALRAAPHI